jgi:hypothetical protein
MSLDIDTALGWRGRTVYDRDGTKVGTLGTLYLDQDDRPAYGGIKSGLLGRRESIIPLDGAREIDEEGLEVPFSKEDVDAAPGLDPDAALSASEEEALRAHYAGGEGARTTDPARDEQPPTGDEPGAARPATARSADAQPATGEEPDATRPAMTRSEEEIRVRPGGEMRPKERVTLRKVLVTDHVTKTVPRRREVIALESDPPSGGRLAPESEQPDDAGAREKS